MIRLGLILLFTGDKRKVQVVVDGVSSFTAESHLLKNGDADVTATYISDSPDSVGNILMSATIGGNAALPPGNYAYYITGTHSGKVTTWYWEILVLAKDLSQFDVIPDEDYQPFVKDVVMYEGDYKPLELTLPSLELSTATGVFKLFDSDVTATYCNGSASVSDDTATTHVIGGQATIPAGEYGYFLSVTHSNGDAITTYYWRVLVLPKVSIL